MSQTCSIDTLRQFLRFALVGLSGMAVGLGTLDLFMMLWHSFPLANVLAFSVAVTWNFLLNRRFTFEAANKPILRQWGEFVVACSGGAILNWAVAMGLYYSFVFFASHYNCAALAGVAAASIVNFLSSRCYVFTDRHKTEETNRKKFPNVVRNTPHEKVEAHG